MPTAGELAAGASTLPPFTFTILAGGMLAYYGWVKPTMGRGGAAAASSEGRMEYLWYHADNFFSSSPYASGLLLTLITIILVVLGGLADLYRATRNGTLLQLG